MEDKNQETFNLKRAARYTFCCHCTSAKTRKGDDQAAYMALRMITNSRKLSIQVAVLIETSNALSAQGSMSPGILPWLAEWPPTFEKAVQIRDRCGAQPARRLWIPDGRSRRNRTAIHRSALLRPCLRHLTSGSAARRSGRCCAEQPRRRGKESLRGWHVSVVSAVGSGRAVPSVYRPAHCCRPFSWPALPPCALPSGRAPRCCRRYAQGRRPDSRQVDRSSQTGHRKEKHGDGARSVWQQASPPRRQR